MSANYYFFLTAIHIFVGLCRLAQFKVWISVKECCLSYDVTFLVQFETCELC